MVFGTRQIEDLGDRLVGALVGGRDVVGVALHLFLVLALADRVRIAGIARLTPVGEQELVLRAVGLLEIDHRQIRARVLFDGAGRDLALIGHEGGDLILIGGLEFGVGEGVEAGAEAFGDAEVRLRGPEADLVVDVVDRRERRSVARDVIGRVADEADVREIGRDGGREEGKAGLRARAFEVEFRGSAAGPGEGRAGARGLGVVGDHARIGVEEHQRVVVRHAVVRRVERGDADPVADVERGGRRGAGRRQLGGAGERIDDVGRQHLAVGGLARRLHGLGDLLVGRERRGAERETGGRDPGEGSERHRVVDDAGRLGGLRHLSVDRHRRAVGARPCRGHDGLSGLAQFHPERLGGGLSGGPRRADLVSADRRAEATDRRPDGSRDRWKLLAGTSLWDGGRAGRDRDVRHGGERGVGGDVALGHRARGDEAGDAAVGRQDARLQIFLDEVRRAPSSEISTTFGALAGFSAGSAKAGPASTPAAARIDRRVTLFGDQFMFGLPHHGAGVAASPSMTRELPALGETPVTRLGAKNCQLAVC
ncbi:hypothetical protein [Chenggangzhangella methanolivorans]|uniref:hypothetical protein n=1 Tax=Chenggangzhangella methanolivorans TaxID=1437009 RepID=UPI0028F45122|nr:hypothetical protein [Chenggangzhangella methanolivorans]